MDTDAPSPFITDSRRDQIFFALAPVELERVRRFGQVRRYGAGEALFKVGEAGVEHSDCVRMSSASLAPSL